MNIRALQVIIGWFQRLDKPTEGQFADTWFSFRHKNDPIPFNEVQGLQEAFDNLPAPAGSTIYNRMSPTNVTVGALAAGTPIAGLPVDEIIEKMTNSFFDTLVSINGFAVAEKGTSVVPTVSGTITPRSGTVTARRVKRGTTVINNPAGNAVSFADAARSTAQAYSIEADYTNSTSGTSTAVAAATLNFEAPMFSGCGVSALTQAQIKALTKAVQTKSNKNLLFSVQTGQVFYFGYPASWGNCSSIKDENGLESLGDFTRRDETWTLADSTSEAYKIYEFATVQGTTRSTTFNFIF